MAGENCALIAAPATIPETTPEKITVNMPMHVGHSIELWQIERLRPYARNARTHSDEQIAKLAASIQRFGFTIPLLVLGDGTIVAGHGRHAAAELLGMTELPVIVVTGWTDDEVRAYVLADNQIALEAGWDEELLKLELRDLRDLGFDLALTGFDQEALAALLNVKVEREADPDDVPDLPTDPVAKIGDLWQLGRHRLLCGDATDVVAVQGVLGEQVPLLMVTDPPYGVKYDAGWRDSDENRARASMKRAKKPAARGAVENDDRADWRDAWDLFPGDVAYVWHADLGSRQVCESLEASRFVVRSQVIWRKNQIVVGRGNYHFQHEPCWYAVRKGKTAHWAGDRKQSTVWDIDKPKKSETGHSTQKPIECMLRPIENNSRPGDNVYDPFVGSGTTIIAAEMAGRNCQAIELSPAYVDVTIERWQTFTGEKAKRL